ncbi:Melanoma-associated antigen E1, partial [Orchesella cincta]
LLVSLVVLGLAFQASARVLRILPAPGCEASSILPVEGGDEVISILPIGGGASILPVEDNAGASILPVEGAEQEYIWPVRPGFGGSVPVVPVAPERPSISLPVLPGAGASILPVAPGASNKLPPAGDVNPISVLPIALKGPSISLPVLPVQELQSSLLPGASNKLPPSGNVNPISILPVAPQELQSSPLPQELPTSFHLQEMSTQILSPSNRPETTLHLSSSSSRCRALQSSPLPQELPNKLHLPGNVNPISILPVALEQNPPSLFQFLPGSFNPPRCPRSFHKLPPSGNVNPISILPVAPLNTLHLSASSSSTSSSSIQQVPPSASISLPVEEEVVSILPSLPSWIQQASTNFRNRSTSSCDSRSASNFHQLSPLSLSLAEADCEQPEAPVAQNNNIPDRYIIF